MLICNGYGNYDHKQDSIITCISPVEEFHFLGINLRTGCSSSSYSFQLFLEHHARQADHSMQQSPRPKLKPCHNNDFKVRQHMTPCP